MFNQLLQQTNSNPTYIFAILGVLLLIAAFLGVRKVNFSTKTISSVAIAVALSAVLSMFKVFQAPFGGSVTIGSMVPIMLISFMFGSEVGILTGFLYGIISLILEPYIVHPVQLLFDYPLAFMALGLAGYIKNSKLLNRLLVRLKNKELMLTLTSAFLAIFARFICHFISGVVFFASDAPKGVSPYLYSALYNGSYLGIDAIICLIILAFIPVKTLAKIVRE